MPAYDERYSPPTRVIELIVANPVTGDEAAALQGKLDTGAAISIIPLRLVHELGLSSHRRIWAGSYDGTYSRREVYYARFLIESREFNAVRCLAIERETVLLGRNVLNRLVILLDGPSLSFELKGSGAPTQ